MKTILTPLLTAILCLSLLAGCSSKKPIVGKWQADGAQMEFTDDGKLVMNMGSVTMNATYTLPDDGHFTMNMEAAGQKVSKTIAYKVDGDTLNTEDGGKKESLKRVK